MEPRPHAPRPSRGQHPGGAGPAPEETGGYQQQPDPTNVVMPPRADYDYSPLDLAPPGQRRKRQLVAAGIGVVALLLIIAATVFAVMALNDDEEDGDSDLAALQTQVATMEAAQVGTPDDAANAVGGAEESAAEGSTEAPADSESSDAGSTDSEQSGDEGDAVADDVQGALESAGEQAAPDQADAAQSDGATNAGSSGGPSQDELDAMLPSQDAMPLGLDVVESSARTETEVVGALGGSREAETNLQEWGWTANVERSFSASDPSSLAPDATTNITVSLHGFADEQAAGEALTFYSDILLNLGYSEVEAPQVGATSRMLEMVQEDGGTTAALYVQDGAVLYRIGGYSPAGDPTTNVVNVAQSIVGG